MAARHHHHSYRDHSWLAFIIIPMLIIGGFTLWLWRETDRIDRAETQYEAPATIAVEDNGWVARISQVERRGERVTIQWTVTNHTGTASTQYRHTSVTVRSGGRPLPETGGGNIMPTNPLDAGDSLTLHTVVDQPDTPQPLVIGLTMPSGANHELGVWTPVH